jgi:hypothetical protein
MDPKWQGIGLVKKSYKNFAQKVKTILSDEDKAKWTVIQYIEINNVKAKKSAYGIQNTILELNPELKAKIELNI